MFRLRLLSRFVIAAITGTLWFTISSANDESPSTDSVPPKSESSIKKPATADRSVPDISGEWDMGRKGSFGRCTVSRVTDGTADFQTSINGQPWVKLRWREKEFQFQGAVIDKSGLFNGLMATFTMTPDETGNKLNGKISLKDLTPELVEAKKKELIKNAGVTQEEIDELFDMQWTRRNTLGQKLAGQPVQIVGNPKSNGKTSNLKENKSDTVDTDSSKSDSKPVEGNDTDLADMINQLLSGGGMPTGGAPGMEPSGPLGSAQGPLNRMQSADILLVETKEGLSAYSKSLGKWVRLVVGFPKDGQRRMKRSTLNACFCHVLIDDQLFGFSSKAGK